MVGGTSFSHAFDRFEGFECAAKTLVKAGQLGTVPYLNDEQLAIAHSRRTDFGAFTPPTAASDEHELRLQLRNFLRRACRQRLFISTEGSFSACVDDDSILITPLGKDRTSLAIDDFVLVRGDQAEAGKQRSRATRSHQAIYRKYPKIQAVVFAHPVNATAFSITASRFDARTIPESYVFFSQCRAFVLWDPAYW